MSILKYYRDENGDVYSFDEDYTSDYVASLVEISEEEYGVPNDPNTYNSDGQSLSMLKLEKAQAVNGLTVIVDDLVFKANDKSIGRMVAAILDAELTGDTSTVWRLADGSNQTVTIGQLKAAQSLAIRAIGALVVV